LPGTFIWLISVLKCSRIAFSSASEIFRFRTNLHYGVIIQWGMWRTAVRPVRLRGPLMKIDDADLDGYSYRWHKIGSGGFGIV